MSADIKQFTVNNGRHPLSAKRTGGQGSRGWCKHEFRIPEIRKAFRDGLSYDGVAKRLGTSRDVIARLCREFELQPPQLEPWFAESFKRLPPILGRDKLPAMLHIRAPKQRKPQTPSVAAILMTPISHGGPLRVADIKVAVCERFRMTVENLDGQDRAAKFSRPRQLAMLLVRELTDHSTTSIGKLFGDRDHTTCLHALKATRKRIEENAEWAEHYSALTMHLSLRPQNDDEAAE